MRLFLALSALLLLWTCAPAETAAPRQPRPAPGAAAPSATQKKDEAIALFKAGRFESAHALLEKLAYAHLADLRLQYYLGRSAYETGRFKEAAAAFERVLIARPDDPVVKFQLARTYFMLHDDSDARYLFNTLTDPQTPRKIRREALSYLALLQQRHRRHIFHGSLLVGLGYDSNAYNAPNTDRFYLPAYQIDVRNTVTNEEDLYHQEALQLHHFYDFGLPGGFAVKNDASVYFQTWRRISANNLVYLNYTPGLLYLSGPWLFGLDLGADKMYFGSDPYLHTVYLVPSVEYRPSSSVRYRLALTLQKKLPDSSAYAGYKANYGMLTLSMSRHFGDDWRFEPGVGAIRERKIDSTLTNVSHDALFAYGDLTRFLGSRDSLGLHLYVRRRRYRDEDLFFLAKREETYLGVRLRYTHAWRRDLRLECNVDRIDNDANIRPYDYTKYNAVVNLIKEF